MHPQAIFCLHRIGTIFLAKKKTNKALQIFEKCYRTGKEIFGQTSPHFLEIQKDLILTNNLAGYY
jgi:hypothetical protein